ncbi:MAG: VWA domain-containing protein [Pseudomonadota bacterium]
MAPWLRARRKLEGAGYGEALCQTYARASITVASEVGPQPAIEMADTLSAVTIKSGLQAGAHFCEAAPIAARVLKNFQRFRAWLSLMQRFAALAPESVVPVLSRTDAVIAELNVSQLEAWLLAGVRLSGVDVERRLAFFTFEAPEAARLLDRESKGIGFFDMDRRLRAYLSALFGVHPVIREAPPGRHDGSGRRSSFGEGFIQMPGHYRGVRGPESEMLFRAALAHIGAHLRFGGRRFALGQLKPLQVAVVSLIEDARVEHLAMAEMPGLRRLWTAFHVAEASGALTAESRFARLSRALIDPDFEDIDGWVRKGRDLFFAAKDQWHDPAISRSIGNLLGNDLGQLRIQFNAKSYAVQPLYRDDNLGLWAFPEDAAPEECSDVIVEGARATPDDDALPPDNEREETDRDPDADRVKPIPPEDPTQGVVIARQSEYDYEARVERPDWVTIHAVVPQAGAASYDREVRQRYQALIARITALVRATRVGRPERLKKQQEGETLDLDACIEAVRDMRSGFLPDLRVYQARQARHRDLSVSVLLDTSASTGDPVGDVGVPIIDVLRDATVVLAHAMAELRDPFSIAAFNSNGRDDVRYTQIKNFAEPFTRATTAALAGIKPGYSTRLGAALRETGSQLVRQPSHRRLILLISDGEPSDIDCPDPKYLVEDARRAVQTLAGQGINVFSVQVGPRDRDTEERIFGRRNIVHINSIAELPEKLSFLYLRLTA